MATCAWRSGLCLAIVFLSSPAFANCSPKASIHLVQPVTLTPVQLAEFAKMPPLRVHAVDAPPMSRYDSKRKTYNGIAYDLLCYITTQLGLEFSFIAGRTQTLAEKLREVQRGEVDVFLTLSRSAERAQSGYFTAPYYESYYAVIARKSRNLFVQSLFDLAYYSVGVVDGASYDPILQDVIPAERLYRYNFSSSEVLFDDLRKGVLDVVVFNRNIFLEKRYENEYFDLDVVHILRDVPRSYRFYFSATPDHLKIVEAFNQYLALIDLAPVIAAHGDGEDQLFNRYVQQRSEQLLLKVFSVFAVLLVLLFYLALRRHRYMSSRLSASHERIQEQQKALQQANLELERLSLTDGLTGLANRRHFDHELAREYSRWQRSRKCLSLMLVDMDYFKLVNDHYGHATGDDYLQAVAGALRQSVNRPSDLAARVGGDEFACILPETSAESALIVADRIRAAVDALKLPVEHDNPYVTVSIGVASLVDGNASLSELLAAADEQLYAAKHAGRATTRATVLRN